MNTKFTEKQIKLAIFLAFVTVFAIFILAGGEQWLNFENLKANRQELLLYTEQNYWTVFFGCALFYILSTTFSLPGATVLSLAIGFLFGRWAGTLLIVMAATIGATLVFLLARYLIADWARARLLNNEQASKVMAGFESDAFNYVLFLRLVPLFPFWLVNLASAFTPVSTKVYTLATLLGIIPGCFVFANLGQSLGEVDSLGQLLSMPMLFAFGLLGLLALSPILLKHYKAYQAANPSDE